VDEPEPSTAMPSTGEELREISALTEMLCQRDTSLQVPLNAKWDMDESTEGWRSTISGSVAAHSPGAGPQDLATSQRRKEQPVTAVALASPSEAVLPDRCGGDYGCPRQERAHGTSAPARSCTGCRGADQVTSHAERSGAHVRAAAPATSSSAAGFLKNCVSIGVQVGRRCFRACRPCGRPQHTASPAPVDQVDSWRSCLADTPFACQVPGGPCLVRIRGLSSCSVANSVSTTPLISL